MKAFFTIILLFVCIGLSAQTLEFSQVKLINTTTETVPVGKVWKVESVMASHQLNISVSTTSNQTKSTEALVNGQSVYFATSYGSSYATGSNPYVTSLPLWLPEGTTLSAGTNVRYISVIEFSVLP